VENYGGAVLMGGRYDNLLKQFDAPMPAVGFAAEVDALAALLLENDENAPKAPTPEVLIWSAAGREIEAQLLLRQLTAEGKVCEAAVQDTEEAARAYAARRSIPRVIVVGSEETI